MCCWRNTTTATRVFLSVDAGSVLLSGPNAPEAARPRLTLLLLFSQKAKGRLCLPAHKVASTSAHVSQDSHIFLLVGGGRRCAASFTPAVLRILLQHLKHKSQKLRKTATRSQARAPGFDRWSFLRGAPCTVCVSKPAAFCSSSSPFCCSQTHQTLTVLRRTSPRVRSHEGQTAAAAQPGGVTLSPSRRTVPKPAENPA